MEKLQNSQKTIKMAICTYLSVTTWSVNKVNSPKDTKWLSGLKKIKRPNYMLATRNAGQL